jgi:hypothetical protein
MNLDLDLELDLQYRSNSYFNEIDTFLCYDNLNRLLVTKMKHQNGFWFCLEKLKYKASSVRVQNFNEIKNERISLKGIEYPGTISKALSPNDIGIIWDNGLHVKKHGLGSYWQNWHNLDFVYKQDGKIKK